jgi:hypothetical protein
MAGNEWDYLSPPWKVQVSVRSPSKKEAGQHIDTFSPLRRKLILKYIEDSGYQLGKSGFKMVKPPYELGENERWLGKETRGEREVEVIEEPGICNEYKLRDEMNIKYFQDLETHFPKWPWAFKRSSPLSYGFQI